MSALHCNCLPEKERNDERPFMPPASKVCGVVPLLATCFLATVSRVARCQTHKSRLLASAMSSSTKRPTKMTSGMEGDGRYSRNNHMTFLISKMAEKPLTQAVDASMSKVNNSSQFTYCDFGAADCGMASVLAKCVVERVRAVDKTTTINVVFEDRPTNDFSSLFSKFQHQITDSSSMENVFVSAVGRSFYKQCMPEESVDLSWSSAAAHWLDVDDDTDPDVVEKVRSSGYGGSDNVRVVYTLGLFNGLFDQ